MKNRGLWPRGLVASALLASLVYGHPLQQQQPEVLRLKSNLVQFDVLVTDKSGTPVTDLEKEDFELIESGKRQEISFFSFVNPATPPPASYPADSKPPGDAEPSAAAGKRTIFIILDPEHIRGSRYAMLYRSLHELINEELLPGDQVSIFSLNGKLEGFQQATDDKKVLTTAVRAFFGNPAPLEDIDPKLLGAQPEQTNGTVSYGPHGPGYTAWGYLRNLITILKAVSAVPGPKVALFISSATTITGDTQNPALQDLFLDVNKAIQQVRNHETTFYAIDPLGIHPVKAAAGARVGVSGLLQPEATVGASISSNEAFGVLDLVDCGCLRKGLPINAPYYRLAYYPADLDKEKLKKVKIQVRGQSHLEIHATSFVWASDGSKDKDAPDREVSLRTLVSNALIAITPVRQLDVSITGAGVVADEKTGKPVVKVDVRIDPTKVSLKTDGVDKLASLEVFGIAFDVNGKQIDLFDKENNLRLKPDELARVMSEGLKLSGDLNVKRPSLFTVRVVVIDKDTNRVGSALQWVRAQ